MNVARLWAVLTKELTDHLRDRRALFSASFGVFSGPIIIGLMLSAIADDRRELEDIMIPVTGAERAPELIDWLDGLDGVTISTAPDDPEQAIRDRQLEVALVIDEDFREDFASGMPGKVKVIFDGSDRQAEGRADRVRRMVGGYAQQIASLRMMARGVSPIVAAPIEVREVEVSTAQSRAARVLGFLPMMILLAAFATGMGAAADATAGERERGSMEALLVNPAPSWVIVSGKWLAASALSLGGSALSLGLCLIVIDWIPLQELGLRFRIEGWQIWTAALVSVPSAMFAPALQMLACSFSRTLKEAQSYLGLLIMLPMAPAMLIIIFNVAGDELWTAALPFFSQTKLLNDVFGGETIDPAYMAIAAAATLAWTLACVVVMARLYRNERVVFGR